MTELTAALAAAQPSLGQVIDYDAPAERLLQTIITQPRQPTSPERLVRVRHRRPLVAGALLSSTLLVGGAAYAAGLIPSDATHLFASMTSPKYPHGFNAPGTRLMVQITLPGGSRFQVWRGTNTAGGICEEGREISPTGYVDPQQGGFCSPTDPWNSWTWTQFGFSMPAYSTYGAPVIIVQVQNIPANVRSLRLQLPTGPAVPLTINPATRWALGYIPAGHEGDRVHMFATTDTGTRYEVGEVSTKGAPAHHKFTVPRYTTPA